MPSNKNAVSFVVKVCRCWDGGVTADVCRLDEGVTPDVSCWEEGAVADVCRRVGGVAADECAWPREEVTITITLIKARKYLIIIPIFLFYLRVRMRIV